MDTETRAAFATLTESMLAMGQELRQEMAAGFARVDRYFELQQAQFLEWRAELRGEVAGLGGEVAGLRGEVAGLRGEIRELRDRVDLLTDRVDRLEREFASFRDFVAREITDIRVELRALRLRSDQTAEMRREIDALTARVDDLERRQD